MDVLNDGVVGEGKPAEADVAAPDMPIGINCADCVHVVSVEPLGLSGLARPTANMCMAPQLAELLDPEIVPAGDAEQCQCARSFHHACGIAARWFVKREGLRYSYICDCWKNNGQGCEAHDPQLSLPEQSLGASQE